MSTFRFRGREFFECQSLTTFRGFRVAYRYLQGAGDSPTDTSCSFLEEVKNVLYPRKISCSEVGSVVVPVAQRSLEDT